MANNKTTYVLEIDAEVSSLKSKLETTKTALDKLGDSSFSIGVGKKITSILMQLEKLQKKASQPIDSKATFSSLEKGFGNIVVDTKNLLSELEKISGMTDREKLSLLPENEAKKLKEALGAVQAYTKAVEKAEKARIRSQERRKGERETTNVQLNTAKETYKNAKLSYTNATAKGTEYGNAKTIVAQAEAAKKAQKEIDQLEKQLKKYQKRLEELNNIENRTEEQEAELQSTRSNVKSVGGKIGARKKVIKNAPDEKTLTAANKIIEDQTPVIEALEQSVTQAEKEVTRLENALTRLDEAIKNNSTEITSSQADYKILYEQAKKLGVSLEGVTEDVNPTNVRILTERMRELVAEGIKPLDTAIDEVTPDIQDLGDIAVQTGEKISGAEEHFSSMVDNQSRIDNLKENIKQFIGWAGASKVLSAAMRNAFEDIKQLDAAMTEIAVVTDFDIGDMWDQMPTYTARANELGLEIAEVYEASALFYQQGLDTNEMIALSNETLKMAKIAGLDAAEATDRMTAALRGFNMELDEASAQKVADVYSELAAITASDVDEISSAMTKTASIASSAGMEFETTAAFLSQIIETTRESAETAGTAMKTVIARFQELKKSPDEIGEVDGEIVDANAIEGALRSVGVSLREAGGQFRELDDVFLELSSKWDGLDKNTQRYIATIAAGSRQQSRFIAMMQDYSRTQELVAAANNSAGASQRQYEKTMESLQTKLKRLENAWTEFSTGLMNSDVVKFAVDFLTSLLNVLNRVTQGFEGFTGSLSKIGTLVAIFQTAKGIVTKFFDELIAKVYTNAYKAGENIAKGIQDGMNQNSPIAPNQKQNKMFGYTQAKQGVEQIKAAKGLYVNDEEAVKWKREYNDLLVKQNKLEKDGLTSSSKYQKTLDEIKKKKEEQIYTAKEAANMEAQGFKNIAQGAQTAAQAITMVGVGIGMVGQMFANAGIEEAGEVFSVVGGIITGVGTAISMLVPIISLLGTTVTVAGSEMTIAGFMTQMAWWPILIILGAIIVLTIGIIAAANAIKKASPEYKLEKAQEAADKAANAADRATEAYENLAASFEELDEGYKTLENLTKGTEEWNKAVEKINSSVLDLITQYPELSKFVDNEGGVLTLDTESAEVQQVLNDAKASAVTAKNSLTVANLNVAKAEDNLAYKNLDDQAKFGLGSANAAAATSTVTGMSAGALAGMGVAAGVGAAVGSVVPVLGTAIGGTVGTIVGAVVGGIGGLIGGIAGGQELKDLMLEDTQNKTEDLAKALADGTLIDTGSGYEITNKEQFAKYSNLSEDELQKYYDEVGDSTQTLRDFGEQLLQTQRQGEAAFGAIAVSAYSLADTLSMTEQEQIQASNIVDDASVKKMYDDNMAKLADIDFTAEEGSNAITDDQRKMRDEAIRAQYGADARIEGNKVTFRDAGGDQKTEELTNDEIKAIIANNMTTKETTKAIEMAPEVVDHVISEMGFSKDSKEAKAIERAVMDQEGGNLTAEEVATLIGLDDKKLEQIYNNMSKEQKNIFGSYEEYLNKIKGAGQIANGAFDDARASLKKFDSEIKSFMTTDMAKGFTSKLEEVAFKAGGEEASIKIGKITDVLLANKQFDTDELTEQENKIYAEANAMNLTDEQRRSIQELINNTDWSNIESLIGLQIDLEQQYGFSEEAAKAYVSVLGDASYATSKLTTTVETFGELWKATEKINQSLKKLADLQWEYDRALKTGAKNIDSLIDSMLDEYKIQSENYQIGFNKSNEDISKIYAQGSILYKTDLRDFVKLGSAGIEVDQSKLGQAIAAGKVSESEVSEWLEKLNKQYETSFKQLEGLKNTLESIEELEQEGRDTYLNLRDMIKETLLADMQKQIDLQQENLDATKEGNNNLINKIQEQIDDNRAARDTEKKSNKISDLYTQLSYLSMSTSGKNGIQILQLQDQISQEEEELTDTLINEAIQNLSNANQKAEEQRERQIELAQGQLDAYELSNEFQERIDLELKTLLDSNEKMDNAWKESWLGKAMQEHFTKGMGELEKEDWAKKFNSDLDVANKWFTGENEGTWIQMKNELIDAINGMSDKLNNPNFGKGLMVDASLLALEDKRKKLKSIDFNETKIDQADETTINDLIKYTSTEDTNENIQNKQDRLESKNVTFKNREDYYNGIMTEYETSGKITSKTYTDYLNSELQKVGEPTKKAIFIPEAKSQKTALDGGGWDTDAVNVNGAFITNIPVPYKRGVWEATGDAKIALDEITSTFDGAVAKYGEQIYIYWNEAWRHINKQKHATGKNEKSTKHQNFDTGVANLEEALKGYKTGGLADFTGPAWLDGTPSKPEYILNAAQTERFFSLVDVLEGFDTNKDKKSSGGDNYFDIEINVEKIEDDYDIEQMANKIRNMIYEDATYRNVNTINHIR